MEPGKTGRKGKKRDLRLQTGNFDGKTAYSRDSRKNRRHSGFFRFFEVLNGYVQNSSKDRDDLRFSAKASQDFAAFMASKYGQKTREKWVKISEKPGILV